MIVEYFAVYSVTFLSLIMTAQVEAVREFEEAPSLKLKKCTQNEIRNITCEQLEDTKEMISEWPPGPYVLPMTGYGCPESSMHGWREGFILFSWQKSQLLHINWTYSGYNLPYIYTYKEYFGPVTPYTFKMNFCYKLRNSTTVDVGSWPERNFSIYAAHNGCPSGFEKHSLNITLPEFTRWSSNGYLPDIRILGNETFPVLQFLLCSRIRSETDTVAERDVREKHDSSVEEVDTVFVQKRTSFYLIKNEGFPCPHLPGFYIAEIVMQLTKFLDTATGQINMLQSFCSYFSWLIQGEEYGEFERFTNNAYSVFVAGITKGQSKFKKFYDQARWGSDPKGFAKDVIEAVHLNTREVSVFTWKRLDFGRMTAISAIELRFNTGLNCTTMSFKKVGCKLSKEPWAFFYSGHDVANIPICRPENRTYLLFYRVMQGRYLTVYSNDVTVIDVNDVISINVFITEHIDSESLGSCNMDLGMSDFGIDDTNIVASSELPEYPAVHSRPFLSGWCGNLSDERPFIQITFQNTTVVEGVTVYNWEESVEFYHQVQTNVVQFGVIAFTVLYSLEDGHFHTYENMSFHLDTSRPFREPHTFWFLKTITTTSIRIVIEESALEHLKCLRLELHGCRRSDEYRPVHVLERDVHAYDGISEVIAFTSEIHADSVITNIGYRSAQSYRWIIRYPDLHYIKLVFKKMALTSQKVDSHDAIYECNDFLAISDELQSSNSVRKIEDFPPLRYAMIVETKETRLVLSFTSCTVTSNIHPSRGFIALVRHQEKPACFSLHPNIPWRQGLRENCRHLSMVITSMAYLGVPFRRTTEQWFISLPRRRIHLKILEFNIACASENAGSVFKIIDIVKESTFCNLNRPPYDIYSAYDTLNITFYKDFDPLYMSFREGFRLSYDVVETISQERLTYYEALYSKVRNVALGKPAFSSSVRHLAGKVTDGITREGDSLESLFVSEPGLDPWWMVDLLGIYSVTHIVIFRGNLFYMADHVEVSTGKTIHDLRVFSFPSGIKTSIETLLISQTGISTRYVRLLLKADYSTLELCEVQVYGEPELDHDETTSLDFSFPKAVDGSWGKWSSWIDICYCDGFQIRRRLCDSPKPDFLGSSCYGNNYATRQCVADMYCEVKNQALKKRTISSSEFPANAIEENYESVRAVDGKFTTCFVSMYEYMPWWLLDLENSFRLEVIRLITDISNTYHERRTRNIEISLGTTICVMQRYPCPEWSDNMCKLNGIKARYVKLQLLKQVKEILHLCEVEIYGQTAEQGIISNEIAKCRQYNPVDGGFSEWSDWSTCSVACGYGLRTRKRSCNQPEPSGGGRDCYGDTMESRGCSGNGTCEICSEVFGKCYSINFRVTNWLQAGIECWRRNTQLVSISSQNENRFIKDMLRERRYFDVHSSESVYLNASFYVHIGLYRKGQTISVWENSAQATYIAWKQGEPSRGNCTRMHFHFFDEDQTWESEDCRHDVAEGFVCERRLLDRKDLRVSTVTYSENKDWVRLPEEIPLREYAGNESKTISGKLCFLRDGVSGPYLSENGTKRFAYETCDDPIGRGYLACHTDSGFQFEECSVRLPAIANSTSVYFKYMGNLSTTYSGKTCQKWTEMYPHQHKISQINLKGESLYDAVNYCRDPRDEGYLWCFTTNPDVRWEPCLSDEFIIKRLCLQDRNDRGQTNVSVSGKACLRWDTQLHSTDQENVCRDPFKDGYSWCYVHSDLTGEDVVREPCGIEDKERSVGHLRHLETETIGDDTFMCKNELRVPASFRCDGKFDCTDLTDEIDCAHLYKVHELVRNVNYSYGNISRLEVTSYFQCTSNEWVIVSAVCNGVIDCLDASDEIACGGQICTDSQFQCGTGDCIHVSQVCNFVVDCVDSSDEYCDFESCSESEYRCENGQCVPKEYRCDALKQCVDGSDERLCDTCQLDVALHCDVVKCVPLRLKCDGYVDCVDGSDEQFCEAGIFTSCEEIWEAGQRESKRYMIGDTPIECDFSKLTETAKIYTIIRNIDFYNDGLMPSNIKFNSDTQVQSILNRENYSCFLQISRTNIPSYRPLADLGYCDIYNFKYSLSHDLNLHSHHLLQECPVNPPFESVTTGNMQENSTIKVSIFLKQKEFSRDMFYLHLSKPFHQIMLGPVVCENEYKRKSIDFSCGNDGQLIPVSQRCVYDIDNGGLLLGCRNGRHLEDCGNFSCPNDTVKCGGSFCLPVRFVCDGELQCPGGQDEENCGCSLSQNEVVILYDEAEDKDFDVRRFAEQFYTRTNIVRVLRYRATRPLLPFGIKSVLLNIRDSEINPRAAVQRVPDCQYNVMANELTGSLKFTNNGTRGIIFVQNSDISSEVVTEMFSNITSKGENTKLYRVIETPYILREHFSKFTAVSDVRIKRWKTLNAAGAEYFGEICSTSSKVYCPNAYKCASSKTCLPLGQVCDGQKQCVHGDDESICDFKCPLACSCSGFYLNCSSVNFTSPMLPDIPRTTRFLDLSSNKMLTSVLQKSKFNLMLLTGLNLSRCDIREVSRNAFAKLRNLHILDLSYNLITVFTEFVFSNLVHLRILQIHGNKELTTIESYAFDNLFNIRNLFLADAKLRKISTNTFAGLNLTRIDLSNNKIDEIEASAFSDLAVEQINFEGNDIKKFNKEIFTGVIGLRRLQTPAYKFCCIRPNYVKEQDCYPTKNEFSSCEDLMRLSVLQFMLWLVGILALLGNSLTIFYRLKFDRKRLKLGFGIFVTNLAVADFLMGVYLIIIAVADAVYRKRYIFFDDFWRNSAWCNLAGVLSTMSSEASVMFLCLITLDRLLVIKFPFGGARFSAKKAHACCVMTWLFSATVAILPVVYEGYFKNEFYSKSGVCIALPLTRDRPPGWIYSLSLFVGMNFVTFILIAFGQLSIFIEMQRSSGISKSAESARRRDLKVARNLLLVVATDFLCWFPIGIMGILAFSGHVISGDVYAWAAVFILPVNSALNPILYTLTAVIGGRKFNPSTEEQSLEQIAKDAGENVLQGIRVSHRLTNKIPPASSYLCLESLSNGKTDISLSALLKISAQVAQCLDTLHCSSLGIRPLDEKHVYVKVRNSKLTGDVKVKGEPFISLKPEEKADNIYHFGLIMRSIISARKKGNSSKRPYAI